MTTSSGPLFGRTALVTGGTRGIGAAIASRVAEAGADVWISGRKDPDNVAERIGGHFLSADLSVENGAANLAEAFAHQAGCLDVLVNNAGLEIVMPISNFDIASFDDIWRVNVRSPTVLLTRLLPLLEASTSASVINVTSIHEATPYPNNAAYAMSKAALGMLTRTASVELGPLGIRVNGLAPGAVETDINRDVIDRMGRERFGEWIPLGRVGTVEEIADCALFLASDAARYVNGSTLYADGGYRWNLVRYRPEAEAGASR